MLRPGSHVLQRALALGSAVGLALSHHRAQAWGRVGGGVGGEVSGVRSAMLLGQLHCGSSVKGQGRADEAALRLWQVELSPKSAMRAWNPRASWRLGSSSTLPACTSRCTTPSTSCMYCSPAATSRAVPNTASCGAGRGARGAGAGHVRVCVCKRGREDICQPEMLSLGVKRRSAAAAAAGTQPPAVVSPCPCSLSHRIVMASSPPPAHVSHGKMPPACPPCLAARPAA